MNRDPASPALQPLDRFVGIWVTDGEMDSGESVTRFEATDEYEWLPGGYFLLHRFHARMPDGETAGIEVISHDVATNSFVMRSFDSTGTSGLMHAHHDGDHWTYLGDEMRFSGGFSNDGQRFSGTWERRSNDGSTWASWMTVQLSKRVAGSGS
jgi:hypothetical protein